MLSLFSFSLDKKSKKAKKAFPKKTNALPSFHSPSRSLLAPALIPPGIRSVRVAQAIVVAELAELHRLVVERRVNSGGAGGGSCSGVASGGVAPSCALRGVRVLRDRGRKKEIQNEDSEFFEVFEVFVFPSTSKNKNSTSKQKKSQLPQLTSRSVPVLETHRYAAACAGGIAHFTTCATLLGSFPSTSATCLRSMNGSRIW